MISSSLAGWSVGFQNAFGTPRGLTSTVPGPAKPGAKPRLLVIGCSVGELDAEISPAGKADHEHRLVDAREFDGAHRAAQGRLKALREFGSPVRGEDMHVAA
jgi:hypothetical protein